MWIILTAYGCEQGNGSTQGLMISKLRLEPFPEKGMALSLISHETIRSRGAGNFSEARLSLPQLRHGPSDTDLVVETHVSQ
jgi:hypothetical protein